MTRDLVRQGCVVLAHRLTGMSEGIRDLTEMLFETVIMVSEETSLFNAVTKLRPDLVVIDLSFPVSAGTGVVSFLRQHAPVVKFIVLGTDDAPEVINTYIAAGASGYLLRWHVAEDLVKALEAVRSGQRYVLNQRVG
jgi:DNA-binding NarL/FixJ family response regulator